MPVNLFSIYGISERIQTSGNEVRKYNEKDTLKLLTSIDLHKP